MSAIVDFLTDRTIEDYERMKFDFSNEDLMAILQDEDKKPVREGLQMAIEKKIETLEVYEDSALVIYQLKGEWETRDSKLVLYQKHIAGLRKHFQKIQFQHVPREENQIADALATLAAMFKLNNGVRIQPVRVQMKVSPAHCSNVEEEMD
ncbi:uncharacterized protein LOC111277618 [Durio zibethinus]|uniref:Uncharacterized protein LOC111277618 n=1 Tax=Durio zibethinus TaxID=66656 RepID=A0A6P5WUH4_DURZI|nr:uncharacterized protein LOC111277618 [Durio zibethinus]